MDELRSATGQVGALEDTFLSLTREEPTGNGRQ
jgi:hypothetical protein